MSNMVTRCPKCATSFRITSGQLKSAKGAVRCGSCLHIFKAQDYFVSSTAPIAIDKISALVTPDAAMLEPSRPPHTPPVKSAPEAHAIAQAASLGQDKDLSSMPSAEKHPLVLSDTSIEHQPEVLAEAQKPAVISPSGPDLRSTNADDDFLISDDMDLIEYSDPDTEESAAQNRARQTLSLFERQIQTQKDDEDQSDPDESWAMHLLDEAENELDNQALVDADNTPNSSEVEKSTGEDTHRLSIDQGIVDEQQDTHKQGVPDNSHAPEPPLYAPRKPLFSLVDESGTANENPAESKNDRVAEKTEQRPNDSRLRAYDSSRATLLMNISPEPLVMTNQHKRRKKPLWFLLGVLMIAILIVQVGWLQFSTLSRIEPYRSLYALVCPQLGCTLPVLVDRNKIRTYSLVVRNHPHTEDILIIDAIILNTATFSQPFPDFALAFSTIDEQRVATRRFTPDEYLDGELAGKHMMPPNQPIHLTLELADPGSDAVNYHAYIPE